MATKKKAKKTAPKTDKHTGKTCLGCGNAVVKGLDTCPACGQEYATHAAK